MTNSAYDKLTTALTTNTWKPLISLQQPKCSDMTIYKVWFNENPRNRLIKGLQVPQYETEVQGFYEVPVSGRVCQIQKILNF
jgi:hypothetical protein